MSTLPDRPSTALLVIDVQNDVVANIRTLVDEARDEGVPVV